MHTGCCFGEKALWAPDSSPRSPAMALALTHLRPSRALRLCPRPPPQPTEASSAHAAAFTQMSPLLGGLP